MIKILHTADVHLDSPLKSLALRDENLKNIVQTATRTAFSRLIDLGLAEGISAILIAGDLFDGVERSAKTAAFLTGQLDRLKQADIAVFYIKGNHDAENPLTGEVSLPDNVHVFDGRGGRHQLGATNIWVHGVSFSGRQAPDSLLPKFGSPEPDSINIAMLHTSLAGSHGHDSYAPCSVAEMSSMGFDYWALGHVHKRQVHSDAPWIVMPGIPQGRDIGEAGPKSATLLTIEDKTISISEVPTSVADFLGLKIDIGGCRTDDEVRSHVRQQLQEAAEDLAADAGLVRLTVAGRADLKWQVLRDQNAWIEVISEIARSTNRLWIEKIKFDFSGEADSTDNRSAVGELETLMAEIREEPAIAATMRDLLENLANEIPTARRARLLPDEEAVEQLVRSLSHAGAESILAAMKGASE
ncbi:putative metallophosphoesterase YhaO [Labrenzia sp. THAF82]|uniref:metallophosphoesterase family protein n=1 Tax=Labrenzia sp. THAF82 TaxID=2587861 RepID=UPI001269625B|nr:DNA repair exonuclease [Labrenzia sp. THAF82]QFT31925.1 putative metallophosphoesterase YhaO [Labrenzia sp. THAF82]